MTLPVEELDTLAQRQYASAARQCGTCRVYHALWPIVRVARQVGGVEADEPFLGPLLAQLIGSTPRHIVLAGSADSGVLALVHRASLAGGAAHRFTVVDRCTTPFDACRFHAERHGIRLDTLQADLRQFPRELQADIIVGHSVLPFLPIEDRRRALASLREGLARGGRVVLSARVAPADRDREEHTRHPGQWAAALFESVQARMRERGVPLPCSDEELDAMIRLWVASDKFQVVPHEEEDVLKEDLRAVGFEVERVLPVGDASEFMKDGRISVTAKKGIVVVTGPKP
ncbi:MAG TPA: class I SAM-dependent methyltransferase [Ramlibacter sp.]|uniref:class I SAM-dependent methyltransferase n=1 Tax=Ramlibacter sp. TaxID=1917967 RepID=UPI002CEB60C9|nr:class I SAM-dependent methyltransferase [Ramlibacter sp.]HVZ42475.1 class I SAM-dependent methyltransferase [Ramlibacter sp.]